MAKSRLIGDYPVIGIRPTIDGRRGALDVRGSLEEQTMNMAKAAAKLFEENIRYSNGEPVKVVIADTTIGRVGEAAACADKFRKAGVDITLTVTPCWCYGSETMDTDPLTIKGVWGLNATERPGAVYLASVLATHAQKGLPAFGIYGHDVQDADDETIPEDVKAKLLRFGRAAPGGGEGHVAEDYPLFRLGFIHRFRAAVYALENAAGGEQPHTFASGYLVVLNDVPHSNFTPFAVLPYHSIILARLQTAGEFFLQR